MRPYQDNRKINTDINYSIIKSIKIIGKIVGSEVELGWSGWDLGLGGCFNYPYYQNDKYWIAETYQEFLGFCKERFSDIAI